MSNSISDHFAHTKGHKLVQVETENEYLCGCCKTFGSGKTFQCSSCSDFNLHEFCGECPRQLSTFMHPLHRLSLVNREQGTRKNKRTCDVCEDDLEGHFYRCKDCDFDLHPICTLLPQNLRHALHLDHPLVLQKSNLEGPCCVCKGVCTSKSWRYRCGECDDFDIHLDCVLVEVVPCTTSRDLQFSPSYTLQTPPQPPPVYDAWMPPRYPSPFYNIYYNLSFVNNQTYMYNPAYQHQPPGYAQPYYMQNPGVMNMNNLYSGSPCGQNLCNIYHNPSVWAPIGSCPYNSYGASGSHQATEFNTPYHQNQHHQQEVGPNKKKRLAKRIFKIVGEITIGVASSVIFGVSFPGLK